MDTGEAEKPEPGPLGHPPEGEPLSESFQVSYKSRDPLR